MFEVLFIMALTVIATVSMVVGIGELIDSKESSSTNKGDTMSEMAGKSEMEKPASMISEIDLVYNDRMSRIEGSQIKGIRKEGNNLILEMSEEKTASTETEDTMMDAIKNNEPTSDNEDMPKSSIEEKPLDDMPAMEPHVENSADMSGMDTDKMKDDAEPEKKDNLMDKIKKMTGV